MYSLTLPYLFEGERVVRNALKTASKLQRMYDTCMILNKESYHSDDVTDALNNLVNLLSLLLNVNPFVLDFALENSGTFTIAKGYGKGKNRISKAIENAINSPLMKKCDLQSSKNIILKVEIATDTQLSAEEEEEITAFINSLPHTAVYEDSTTTNIPDDDVYITILASGFDVKLTK